VNLPVDTGYVAMHTHLWSQVRIVQC